LNKDIIIQGETGESNAFDNKYYNIKEETSESKAVFGLNNSRYASFSSNNSDIALD